MDKSKKYYSIGEVAKLKDITVKALRYYHEIGLLTPRYVDKDNGYRYYSTDQLLYLDIIIASRSMNVSIKELQELFSFKDTNYIIRFLNDKHKQIEIKINDLREAQGKIINISNKITEDQAAFINTGFKVDYYKERYIITYPISSQNSNDIIMHHLHLEHLMKKYSIKTKYITGQKFTINSSNIFIKDVFEVIDETDYIKYKKDISLSIIPMGYFLTFTFTEESQDVMFRELYRILEKHNLKTEYLITINLYADIFNIDEYKGHGQLYLGKMAPSYDILAQNN